MIVYVLVGGMRGTTWVQIIKAVLLIIGAAVMTVWVLGLVRVQPLGAARRRRGQRRAGEQTLLDARQLQYGKTITPDRLPLARRWRWCSAPRACRTC